MSSVSKDRIKLEFDLFAAVWNTYKKYYIPEENDEYWDALVDSIKELQHKYPGELSKALSLAVLDDIERRYRECRR